MVLIVLMEFTIIGIVGGAIISILITIAIEYLRRPNLHLMIEQPPQEVTYQDNLHPARFSRYLRLHLFNKPLPKWARWMLRSPAIQCKGTITFHHLDGQNVFGRAMAVRWAGSPQPLPIEGVTEDNKRFQVFDPTRLSLDSRIDVYPGDQQLLDVACRLDDDEDCFGWNNESYLQPMQADLWRTPDWRLQPGRYLVRVSISSSGQTCVRVFRLINDVGRRDFRLEPALPGDNPI